MRGLQPTGASRQLALPIAQPAHLTASNWSGPEARERVLRLLAQAIARILSDREQERSAPMMSTLRAEPFTCTCAGRRWRRSSATRRAFERQYELTERAVALGWGAHGEVMIVVRTSAARARARRPRRLRAAGRRRRADRKRRRRLSAARLARRNANSYQLLDLCALTDTLIADADGVYHPAAAQRPARARPDHPGRGDRRRDRDRVLLDELSSARQVMLRLLEEERKLPRDATRRPGGSGGRRRPTRRSTRS